MTSEKRKLYILFIGPQHYGSDAGGLARAFRQLGHIVQIMDPYLYYPVLLENMVSKICRKVAKKSIISEFNRECAQQLRVFKPDLLVSFKGDFTTSHTLQRAKQEGIYSVMFYPDVSMFAHGSLIPETVPLYDYIFTSNSNRSSSPFDTFLCMIRSG